MKKALVLVRNPTDRKLLSAALADFGLETCFTHALNAEIPSELAVVLVEEALAELWKHELLSLKQRATAELRFLPVLVIVPQGRPVEKWLSLGFDDIVTIPISRKLLETQVTSWTELSEETAGRFRELVETAQVGFYRTTPEGKILYANPALVKLLGYESLAELAQRDLSREGFAPESPRTRFQEAVEKEGVVTNYEAVWLTRDGQKVFVVESARAVRDKSGKVLYYEGTVQDITPLRRYQEKLAKIGDFGRKLVLARTTEEVAQAVVNAARDILGLQDCGIFVIEGEQVTLLAHSLGTPPGPSSLPLHSERGVVPYVARTGRALYLPDVRNDPRFIPGALPSQSELCLPLKIGERVIGVLNLQSPELAAFGAEETRLAEALADVAAIALENARLFEEITKAKENLAREAAERKKLLEQVVAAFSAAMGLKDPFTAKHQERVARLACAIAEELGLPPEQVEGLRVAALLHDVGKVLAVPNEILSKPGKLSDHEMALIRTHPDVGYELLCNVEFPWPVAEIVRQHHERLDGSGYPRGLKGEEILLEARILAVADVVEAISSFRPYRPALGLDKAFEEIQNAEKYDQNAASACRAVFARGFTFG
ncbi:HD domain-containing protein [Candidatus Bipolaricaulota bacterium]|nr:HD domain-containing protein [Thermoplasmatales archaeon]MBC7318388.1 HD domain-containing protein [Candidatus Bipolaricaulota bacterium]